MPDDDDAAQRAELLARLQAIATQVCTNYPNAKLQPFGSSVSGLHKRGADLDLTLVLDEHNPTSEIEIEAQRNMVSELAEKIEASGQMESVIARPKARVPVVVLVDNAKASGLHCDICMCNRLALINSRLLRAYMQLDPRARQLAFIVKYWAKRRSINEPYHGSPSSYAWVLCGAGSPIEGALAASAALRGAPPCG